MYDLSSLKLPESNFVVGLHCDELFKELIKSTMSDYKKDLKISYVEIFPGKTPEDTLLDNSTPSFDYMSNNTNHSKEVNSAGIISKSWIENLFNKKPSCVVVVYNLIKHLLNKNIENISLLIFNELQNILQAYKNSIFYIILMAENNNVNSLSGIKNTLIGLCSKDKFINSESFLLLNLRNKDNLSLKDSDLENIAKKIKDDAEDYYKNKKSYYNNLKQRPEIINNKEIINKIEIKYGVVSYITHKSKINYKHFSIPYHYFSKKINKDKNLFTKNIEKYDNYNLIFYFNLRLLCDWLLINRLEDKNLKYEDIKLYVFNHIYLFDYKNYLNSFDNNVDINNIQPEIQLSYLLWKYQWLNYIMEQYKKKEFPDYFLKENNFIILRIYSLLRIYNYMKKNEETVKKIKIRFDNKNAHSNIDVYKGKYLESLPVFKRDNVLIESSFEIINCYFNHIHSYIFDKNYLTNNVAEKIKKYVLEEVNNGNKCSFYLLNKIILKYNDIFIENETCLVICNFYDRFLSNFKNKYDNLESCNQINKYKNILQTFIENYCHYLKLLEPRQENNVKILSNLFILSSLRNLTEDEETKIYELINLEYSSEVIIFVKDNSFISIDSEFSKNYTTLFDIITLYLEIKLNSTHRNIKRENIKINNLVLSFSNNRKKGIKELELSDKPIKLEEKLFITYTDVSGVYLENIILELHNKLTLEISINHTKKNTLNIDTLNVKSNNDLIEIKSKVKYVAGLNEYHYYNFEVLKNNNLCKDLYINLIKCNFYIMETEEKVIPENHFIYLEKNKLKKVMNIFDVSYMNLNTETNKNSIPNEIDFLLQIKQEGSYYLYYGMEISLSHNSLKSDFVLIEKSGIIIIDVIKSFGCSFDSNCNLIKKEKDLLDNTYFPSNHKINMLMTLHNNLDSDLIINKIDIKPTKRQISISTKLNTLIRLGKKLPIIKHTDYNIPFNIVCSNWLSDSPGKFTIFWRSEEMEKFCEKYQSENQEEVLNTTTFLFDQITVNRYSFDIECDFDKCEDEGNEYYSFNLKIKNNEQHFRTMLIKIETDNSSFILIGAKEKIEAFLPLAEKKYKLFLERKGNMESSYNVLFPTVVLSEVTIIKEDSSDKLITKEHYNIKYNPNK